MALFRKISFYLAIFGIVTLIALVKTMNAAPVPTVPLVKPAVNLLLQLLELLKLWIATWRLELRLMAWFYL
jgi:hypothetical protein